MIMIPPPKNKSYLNLKNMARGMAKIVNQLTREPLQIPQGTKFRTENQIEGIINYRYAGDFRPKGQDS